MAEGWALDPQAAEPGSGALLLPHAALGTKGSNCVVTETAQGDGAPGKPALRGEMREALLGLFYRGKGGDLFTSCMG